MAAPPPPFDTTGVNIDDNRQLGLQVAAWFCTGTAACTVAMKLFTKARIVKMVGWDDFIILLSLTLSVIAASLVSSAVAEGLGRHTAAVLAEPDGAQRLVNTTSKLQVGYALHIGAFSFPNIAIALLVVQLLDRNVVRAWALYGLVGLQAAAAVASMGIVLGQCGTPARQRWWAAEEAAAAAGGAAGRPAGLSAAGCWDPAVFNDFSYFVAAYTALTDAVLAAVPVAAFWRLQMPARTKLGVCLLMGLTLLSAIVTVVKACYLHLFTDFSDPLWNVVPLVVWSLIEQNVVIVAACIPTLRPMFTKGLLLPFHHHHHHHHHNHHASSGAPQTEESSSWFGSWKSALHEMKTHSGDHHRRLFTERRGGSQPPPKEESSLWFGSWKSALHEMKTQRGGHHRSLFTERPRRRMLPRRPPPTGGSASSSSSSSWRGAWKPALPVARTRSETEEGASWFGSWKPSLRVTRTRSETEEAPSWFGSWKPALPALGTPRGGPPRRLFTERGRTRPWRPRATSTSDTMPLRRVDPHPGPGDRRRSRPPAVGPDAAAALPKEGIVRTVAVALEWDVRRPPSAHSAQTDWLVPPPPPPKPARAKRNTYAP